MSATSLQTLDQLLALMQTGTQEDWIAAGLAPAHGDLDWTDLPVFGGSDPRDTREVWSWDADRLLIGTCSNDLEIVARDSEFGRRHGA